jgi:hypothetical protein
MDPEHLWRSLPTGYLLTIFLETPVLLVGLSPCHPWTRKLFAGVWLTACTYPIVVLVLPLLLAPLLGWWGYVAVAEVFAPAAECLLFWAAFRTTTPDAGSSPSGPSLRDYLAIIAANLTSFGIGLLVL